ncbi:MAG: hypothetical protein ACJATQ_000208 [Cellvibrionaceae bacterium]|jgi:hypothetical protein
MTDLSQQLIAGNMPTSIVDNLELIEIEVSKYMSNLIVLAALHCKLQILFDASPIDQTA